MSSQIATAISKARNSTISISVMTDALWKDNKHTYIRSIRSVPGFSLMSLVQTQMIQHTCATKTMRFHEHINMVRGLLPIQLRDPVGNLQIPMSIKFLYTYSTFFTSHQDLPKHMGGTYTKGTEGRDLAQNNVNYVKYDKCTHV